MSDNIKKQIKEKQNNKFLSTGFKLILFIIIIILLLQSFTIYTLLNKNDTVVGITEDGIPLKLEKKDKEISNLVNMEQFMRNFVNLMYDWNSNTYENSIKKASNLMSNNLEKQYMSEIKKGGYIEQVKKYEITSSFTIRNVGIDNIKNYKDGYKIIVQGYKLEITDFIDRKKPIKLEIGFRTTDISQNNIWGIEVFEIKESEM